MLRTCQGVRGRPVCVIAALTVLFLLSGVSAEDSGVHTQEAGTAYSQVDHAVQPSITRFLSGRLMTNLLLTSMLVLMLLLVIVAFYRTRNSTAISANVDDFLPSKYAGILDKLRSGNKDSFKLGLVDFTWCPIYREDVLKEVAKAAGRVGRYADNERFHFLEDVAMRCKIALFLHVALERKHMWDQHGRLSVGTPTFEQLYDNRTYCRNVRIVRREGIDFVRLFWHLCAIVRKLLPSK